MTDFFGHLCVVCLLAATSAPQQAASEPFDVLAQPARLSRLAAVTPVTSVVAAGSHFVAIGPRGHVLLSEADVGKWNQVPMPTSADLTAAHFVSDRLGWVVGHGGVILHTQDGGGTWVRQMDGRTNAKLMVDYYQKAVAGGRADLRPMLEDAQHQRSEGPGRPLLSVWFSDAEKGYAVGAFGMILRTDDGGMTWMPWQHRIDNPRQLHLTAVVGDGTSVYIVGEQGLILRLDERTQRFVSIDSPYKGTFFGAVIPEPGGLLVFGMRGEAYYTSSAGAHWKRIESGRDEAALTGGAVLSRGVAVVVTQSSRILVYRTGQDRMEALALPPGPPYAGVAVSRSGAMALVGFGGARTITAAELAAQLSGAK